jgi:putative MATE family efflux protein
MLLALGTPKPALPLAEAYLRMVFVGMPSMMLMTFLGMALRGFGDSRTPFWFMLLASVLDVALNPLLIAGLGPFPRLGIAGAATAMLIAQAVSLAALIAFIYARKMDLRLTGAEFAYLRPAGDLLGTMILKGLPMGAQMLEISFSGIVMLKMINAYGAETVAAYGVTMQLWTYVQMPAMAIGIAVSAMAAQNVGAQRWERVEQTARAGVMINFALTGALVLISYAADHHLLQIFLPGARHTIAIAEHINAPIVWSFIPFGVMFVLFGVVRSTGAVTPPLVILAISLLGVRLTFAGLLEPVLGQDAIWWSFPVSMMVACAMAILYYRYGRWRRARMGRASPPPPAGIAAG